MRIAVIGATGQIGRMVVDCASGRGLQVVACGRGTMEFPQSVETRQIGEYSIASLAAAIDGCSSVVATVGLPYRASVWLREWPTLVTAIAAACEMKSVPLTVLDNLYVYGDAANPISESTPLAPCSRKGQARLAGFAALRARRDRGQDIVVCRASDFVGVNADVTILPWRAVTSVLTGRSSTIRWIGDPSKKHSFSATEEVAAALVDVVTEAALRTAPVLHLPVLEAVSGNEVAASLSTVVGEAVRLSALRPPMMRLAALVAASAREQAEMMYQVERDFIVSDEYIRELGWSAPKKSFQDLISR